MWLAPFYYKKKKDLLYKVMVLPYHLKNGSKINLQVAIA